MAKKTLASIILVLIMLSFLITCLSALYPVIAKADLQEAQTIPVETQTIIETLPQEDAIPLDVLIPPELIPTPEEVLWQQREAKYPVATRLWRHMKEKFGWSDEMCAGVIGNVMAETGARTLDIPFKIYKKGPFGLFQWTKGRHKDIVAKYGEDATIEEQLDFVYDELYGTDGVRKQVKNWQREKMLNAKTAEKAAKYFCIWFERPGGKGTVRPRYARIAYEYFTSEGA